MNNDRLLRILEERPLSYAPNDVPFWDDAQISKGMLAAHLDPEKDAATRRPDFVKRSVRWIAGLAGEMEEPRLLDLGCGPGIYTGLFEEAGFNVTGMDISRRSIAYAREKAAQKGSAINYIHDDYRQMDYDSHFDFITLIFCDFGVLSPDDRAKLLKKIYRALRPGGLFIVDVCSIRLYENRPEEKSWRFEASGFWSARPHACFYSFFNYEDSSFMDRYVIAEKDDLRCYHICNHRFSKETLIAELNGAGFAAADVYSNVAGDTFSTDSETICAVARR